METNNDILKRISSLSPEQFKEAISSVADALGASPMQKKLALNNASLIKKKMSGMSQAEMEKFLSKVSPAQKEELLKKLRL